MEFIKQPMEIEVLKGQDLTNLSNVVKSNLPKYWDRDYINCHINALKNYKHKMLLKFLWMTGTRITEAINVRKADLDFQNYMINIRWQKNRKWNYRNIPMHPILKNMLEIFTAPLLAEDRIFPLTRQRAWQIIKKQFGGHPHRFRHSFAVNWLRCGGEIYTLSKMLGHSKIQSTMVYLEIVPIDQGKELIKIQF